MPNQISKKLRSDAFHSQSGLCYYCKSVMWLKDKEDFAIKHSISMPEAKRFQCTAEHLTARCDGGSNKKNNIVAACLFCNQKRHQRKSPPVPLKFIAFIQKRLKQGKWHPKKLHHLVLCQPFEMSQCK